jgi:hypothetical protein
MRLALKGMTRLWPWPSSMIHPSDRPSTVKSETSASTGNPVIAAPASPWVESGLPRPGNISYLREEEVSLYFGNVLRNHLDFVSSYPEIVKTFLNAFEHRHKSHGFPEFALGEGALTAVVESMFKHEPSERCIAEAHSLPTRAQRYGSLPRAYESVADYMQASGGILSKIALTRPLVVMSFYRNLHRAREDVVRYVAALHLDYIDRRDDAPL